MGTTKIYPYSEQTLQLAQIAKALGHPARITLSNTCLKIIGQPMTPSK